MASVIQLPIPAVTPFPLQEIVGRRGGVITTWLSSDPGSRAKLRIRVGNLRRMRRTDWTDKVFKNLGAGLSEIKWKYGDVPYRALGCDHEGYFVLVIGCTHKMKAYNPRNCIDTARRLIAEVKNGQHISIRFEP